MVAGRSDLAVPESAVIVPTGATASRPVVVAEEKVVILKPSSPRLQSPVPQSKPQLLADRYLNLTKLIIVVGGSTHCRPHTPLI